MVGAGQLYLTYWTAVALGLLHGSDPGHGWLLPPAHSVGSRRPHARTLYLTWVLATGHFVSTLAVVTLVWALGSVAAGYVEYISAGAGALLVLMGGLGLYKWFKRGEGSAGPGPGLGAAGLFKYSLVLGFAHEEEVALATMILLGADPLALALSYSAAVYASMSAWALATLRVLRVRGVAEAVGRRVHALSSLFLVAVGVYALTQAGLL